MSSAPDSADRTLGDTADLLGAMPPARHRVADHVFETLAKAILAGRFEPGTPLPTQRALAKQFNISALVVRQAIHRLEELGLVRVRQGSSTIVLDPQESSDIRLIQLRVELAAPEPELLRAVLEVQILFVVPLIVLAQRRITPEQLAKLGEIADSLAEDPSEEVARNLRVAYFEQMAEAAGNAMFQQQIRWWKSITEDLRRRSLDVQIVQPTIVARVYRRVNEALAKGQGAVEIYLRSIEPLLAAHEQLTSETQEKA